MNTRVLPAAAFAILAACGRAENPLLAATDAQFARLIEPKNAFSASCAAALYEPELFVRQYNGLKFGQAGRISAVDETLKADCAAELQRRAAEAGLPGEIKREHFADDRVRQRYFAARKG
jgi:hypothetical protein